MTQSALQYVETGGGPFILLPLALRRTWGGVGSQEADDGGDYGRAEQFGTGVGVLKVGSGQALIIGNPEVTAFWPLPDGGVFVQRAFGDEDADVIAAVEEALANGTWTAKGLSFDAGNGKVALFDSVYAYDDSDEDKRLKLNLASGKYAVETCAVKTPLVELELVRIKKS